MSEYLFIGLIASMLVVLILVALWVLKSFHNIPENKIGSVVKKFGKSLPNNDFIALRGEAGNQVDLLMPGWRFKPWPFFTVNKYDRVQIKPGEIGVVIAQVGNKMPTGNKTAEYKDDLGDFSDLRKFLENGGQRGPQRPVLEPGTYVLHPAAFLVVSKDKTYGKLLSADASGFVDQLKGENLSMTQVRPDSNGVDQVGIVTALDGPPSDGSIASRLGGFEDIKQLEDREEGAKPAEVIELLLNTKNQSHNNYQDFQKFLDQGGRIGEQHDPLLPGTYALNPLLVRVELKPMLVINQGEVAVIKAFAGLPTIDTSGTDYKYGSIVAPGHMGLWSEPLRTGKYALNTRVYASETVPTSILTLNWAKATSEAHDLDKGLSSIGAKSKDAFDFSVDLQVQIHVPDTKAPQVIGSVATMQNLVNEVLQSVVGNYFRNKIQEKSATDFITSRTEIQNAAAVYVTEYLQTYNVEVRGVYIQDVIFPDELTKVLKEREIANQQKTTFAAQQTAEVARIDLERQRGTASAQADLAKAEVSIDVNKANAKAAIAEAEGKATVTTKLAEAEGTKITTIGNADASAISAKGLAQAESYDAQQKAIGREQTAAVALAHEIGVNGVVVTPQIVVGDSGAGGLGGLLSAALARSLASADAAEDEDTPAVEDSVEVSAPAPVSTDESANEAPTSS